MSSTGYSVVRSQHERWQWSSVVSLPYCVIFEYVEAFIKKLVSSNPSTPKEGEESVA